MRPPVMPKVLLGEGNTPLVPSVRIGPALGLHRLCFKLESCNPTGSFKDRFAAAEVSRMAAEGVRACLATSSGNTGASLAAYAARCQLRCTIVVPDSAPAAKLAQMQAHGARILRLRGFVSDPDVTAAALQILEAHARLRGEPLVVSAYRYSPAGMAAVESLGTEILAQCPDARHVFVPAGGGGLLVAVCRGIAGRARVHAVQPAGCSTVVAAFERGDCRIVPVRSTTRISGLSVPFDIDASLALTELVANGGRAVAVTDEEILDAQRRMLELEGIYCEPAGAAALAGLLRSAVHGVPTPDEPAVCLVTGHGFKDPDAIAGAAARFPSIAVTLDGLEASLA